MVLNMSIRNAFIPLIYKFSGRRSPRTCYFLKNAENFNFKFLNKRSMSLVKKWNLL